MRTIDELDLILTLLRKHELPISPILEYAINEKKEELKENSNEENEDLQTPEIAESVINFKADEEIVLTRELIEAARTPNGGFTKSQLAAIGIAWPPPQDWIEQKIGERITKTQLDQFKTIKYVACNKISNRKK